MAITRSAIHLAVNVAEVELTVVLLVELEVALVNDPRHSSRRCTSGQRTG